MTVTRNLEKRTCWGGKGRLLIFLLASTSIFCLLADFYGLCSMHLATKYVLLPAVIILGAIALADRFWGDHRSWYGILIGILAGLAAAVAYDVFRLPFVFAKAWGIEGIVPHMDLFKVFPRFGAMFLNEAVEQPTYRLLTRVVGWTYHFSNGATFGVMFVAAVGQVGKKSWKWAVLMAVGLEAAMLATPYTRAFGIPLTPRFVIVTLIAHLIFGIAMAAVGLGLATRWSGRLPRLASASAEEKSQGSGFNNSFFICVI
jgi:hypothetical protein